MQRYLVGEGLKVIPLLLQNPKVLVGNDADADAEVDGHLAAEIHPFLRNGFTRERKDGVGERL